MTMKTRTLASPWAAQCLSLGLSLGFLAACEDGSASFRASTDNGRGETLGAPGAPGDVAKRPDPGPKESRRFIVDPNGGGQLAEVRVVRAAYGRLVDVYSVGAKGRRVFQQKDFVVDPALDSDGVDYLLEEQPVTGATHLVILRSLSTPQGIAEFEQLLVAAAQNLPQVFDKGLPEEGTFWSMVPRNAALVVQLDDLLDETSLDPATVRTLVGDPNVIPFEGRLLADQNHGDWVKNAAGEREFHTTRVVVDTTVQLLEALESDPPLPVNTVGLPPSVDVNRANLSVRIPTKTWAGQTDLLVNLAGNPLATAGNGTIDFGSPSLDVVRAGRSGGDADVTSDPFNGFLPDATPPRLVFSTPITILSPPLSDPFGGPLDFELAVAFDGEDCGRAAERGDAILQGGFLAIVTSRSIPPEGGVLPRVKVRLESGSPTDWPNQATGPAVYSGAWTAADVGLEPCVPQVSPEALGYPDDPTRGIQPTSTIRVAFSEPVVADSAPSDGLALTRGPLGSLASGGFDWIPADVLSSGLGSNALVLAPVLPLTHAQGSAESFFLQVQSGPLGVIDLAGNPLVEGLTDLELLVDPQAPDARTFGHVTRFASADEDPPYGAPDLLPEWWGQHFYDLQREEIRPRPVVRFERFIERSNPITALMTPFTPGVTTPLGPFGAKLQAVWRYADVGLSYNDASDQNLDVEGLAWSPIGGSVTPDVFPEFEIALAHSKRLPDEYIDPNSLFPQFPNSGLQDKYAGNVGGPRTSLLEVVHDRAKGYTVDPGDLYSSPTGTPLVPFPWNEGADPGERTTYTWRDTSLRFREGTNSGGLPQYQEFHALGLPQPLNRYFREGNVRSVGLPLLLEFRCWPNGGTTRLNSLDVSLAANSSSKPYFRAFSAGGVDQGGNTVLVDPDLEEFSNGGFNPNSNPPGAQTYGRDNVAHIGSMDFVVRVSRSHSVFLQAVDAAGNLMIDPTYLPAVLEGSFPAGTSVQVAYRGVEVFNPVDSSCDPTFPNLDPLFDARTLDLYGDHYDDQCIDPGFVANHNPVRQNRGLTFVGDEGWKDDVADIQGASYFQLRLTFASNTETGLTPTASTVGVAWSE